MAKNASVTDQKPKNSKVVDTKPNNATIATDYGTEQLFTVVLAAGQYIGLPYGLSYVTAGTVQSPITN